MSNLYLAKRAVACGGWRWMPGMLTTDGVRVSHNGDQLVGISHDYKRNEWCEIGFNGRLPDLDDPATLGCLEQLVCDVHGVQVWLDPDWRESGSEILSWSAVAFLGGFAVSTFGHGPNKAAAWVSALEAASC